MQHPRTRRVQRIHLTPPLTARYGTADVVLVDLSVLGARIEHHQPLPAGTHARLAFLWEGAEIAVECRIVRSRLERFTSGADGLTVFHSGLEFENISADSKGRLKWLIGSFIMRALEEQKLNARGVLPQHHPGHMPIFRRGGQLTTDGRDLRESVGDSPLPTQRIARDSGYVCYMLERGQWRKKRTHDPGQPEEGFTISAFEDPQQVGLLCEAYQASDDRTRRMIQLFSQLSIMEGEGIEPGRFEP